MPATPSCRCATPRSRPCPEGAVVGTSSLRRECQLRRADPSLVIKPLRGNVNTRLAKLEAGDYDAIILAAAGFKRLGFGSRIRELLPLEVALPAIGQGVLAIELRTDRADLAALAPFEHAPPAAAAAPNARWVSWSRAAAMCRSAGTLPLPANVVLDAFLRLARRHAPGARPCRGPPPTPRRSAEMGQRILDRGGREMLALLAKPARGGRRRAALEAWEW